MAELPHACGPCNGPKRNNFPLLVAPGNAIINVARGKDAPVSPPLAGNEALIDPRREDPMRLLQLDLIDSFRFVPIALRDTVDHVRALQTCKLLGLNDRDYLRKARKIKFLAYRSMLADYISRRDAGAVAEARLLEKAILDMDHPTVWEEMKRWAIKFPAQVPELATLFRQAPESIGWTR